MKLFIGIGNPGSRFTHTRHNIGSLCIDRFSQQHELPLTNRRRHVLLGVGEVDRTPIVVAKSRTYMNDSGEAASSLLRKFKAVPHDLTIVYDDLDLPLGTVRIRIQGSSGGHRGMDSIIQTLGSYAIPRIRVGIGRPSVQDEVAYVLSPFEPEEKLLVQETVTRVSDAMLCILKEGLDQAMNRYN